MVSIRKITKGNNSAKMQVERPLSLDLKTLRRSWWPNSAVDFFIFIILNTKVPLMFSANLLPNGSREEVDFVVFAFFISSDHLGFST